MADVSQRVWRSGPRKVKRAAWGYTVQINGKQERRFDGSWTRDDAQKALAARLLAHETVKAPKPPMTFGEAVTRYLGVKESDGKRSLHDDRLQLERLKTAFGAATPLAQLTAARISEYKEQRARSLTRRGTRISPATLNRELAALRHLLRLAAEEWQVIERAPLIRLAKEPQGRLRFLTEDEIARLLAACADETRRRQSPHLAAIVTIALNTGMRKSEILGLVWERVDFARGVLLLEMTKSGRRREVPMNQAVYEVLSDLPGEKERGPVFRKAGGTAWGNVRTAFTNACTAAKIDGFRFHDLRHTFASHMMMRGATIGELKDLLGHADVKMTMRYAHLSPAHRRAAVARLEGLADAPKPSGFSTTSAQGDKIEPASFVSTREAGVAQRQSN